MLLRNDDLNLMFLKCGRCAAALVSEVVYVGVY